MKTSINLLPPALRRRHVIRRRATQWTVVVCAVALVMWGARWNKQQEFRAIDRQLEIAERETQPAQIMLTEITRMRYKLEHLNDHEIVAEELDEQRHVLVVLGLVSQAAQQTNGNLRLTHFAAADFQSTVATADDRDDELQRGSVTLVGASLDGPPVAEFHDVLHRSGLFADVRLIKSTERREGDRMLYDYEVRCEL